MNTEKTGIRMDVDLGGIKMKNPVMVASGTFGYGPEYADLTDLNQLGAFVVKGVRRDPWPGNPTPRMVEVPGGLVNAIGLQNPGVSKFVSEYMPFLRKLDTAVIVNIWGQTIEEYEDVALVLDEVPGVAGLELNISCPNVKVGGAMFGTDPRVEAELVSRVRKRTHLPLIPKLFPHVWNIREHAHVCEEAGADALSLINSIPAMVVDIETRKPVLANKVGGLSGPAIHPVALKLVWETAQAVKIPVVGIGGIMGPEQALGFLIAGASAVAVGTANFSDPTTALRVTKGIEEYLKRHNIAEVSDLVGTLQADGA